MKTVYIIIRIIIIAIMNRIRPITIWNPIRIPTEQDTICDMVYSLPCATS